jgi:hypothetical protein
MEEAPFVIACANAAVMAPRSGAPSTTTPRTNMGAFSSRPAGDGGAGGAGASVAGVTSSFCDVTVFSCRLPPEVMVVELEVVLVVVVDDELTVVTSEFGSGATPFCRNVKQSMFPLVVAAAAPVLSALSPCNFHPALLGSHLQCVRGRGSSLWWRNLGLAPMQLSCSIA